MPVGVYLFGDSKKKEWKPGPDYKKVVQGYKAIALLSVVAFPSSSISEDWSAWCVQEKSLIHSLLANLFLETN